jgi:hypothetical protein
MHSKFVEYDIAASIRATRLASPDSHEENRMMRKLCLTLVASAAMLSAAALSASALTPGSVGGVRAAVEDSTMVQQARYICTHWWNGRHHWRRRCVWRRG